MQRAKAAAKPEVDSNAKKIVQNTKAMDKSEAKLNAKKSDSRVPFSPFFSILVYVLDVIYWVIALKLSVWENLFESVLA